MASGFLLCNNFTNHSYNNKKLKNMHLLDFALADEKTLIANINESLQKQEYFTIQFDENVLNACKVAFGHIKLLKSYNEHDSQKTNALDIVDAMDFKENCHISYKNTNIAANMAATWLITMFPNWANTQIEKLSSFSDIPYKTLYVKLVQTIEIALRYFILEPEKTIPVSQTRDIIRKMFQAEKDNKCGISWEILEKDYSEGEINSICQLLCNYGLLETNNTLELHGYRKGCLNYYNKGVLQLHRLYFCVYYHDKILSKVINNRLERLNKIHSLNLLCPLPFKQVDIRLDSLCKIEYKKYTSEDIEALKKSLSSLTQFVLDNCQNFRNILVIIAKDYNLQAMEIRENEWYKIHINNWSEILPAILKTCYDIVVGTNKNKTNEKDYSYIYSFEFCYYQTVISKFIPEFGELYKNYKKDKFFKILKEIE